MTAGSIIISLECLRQRWSAGVVTKLQKVAESSDGDALTFPAAEDSWFFGLLRPCLPRPARPEPAKPAPARIIPKPALEWPEWARVVESYREPGEVGVGSTAEKMLDAGGVVFKAVLAMVGASCRCDVRRQKWDELYPY